MGRGTLRIYVGAAPGAGTTYAMLAEGRRRAGRGTDVVVAAADARGRRLTHDLLAGLQIVPLRPAERGGHTRPRLDVDAVLARRPAVALVDDLAARADLDDPSTARWHDAERLLDAGIDVVATMTVSAVESLGDVVARITGRLPVEVVPDAYLSRAEQIEVVDITPEALRRRLAHGNIAPAEQVDAEMLALYRPGTLAALRELTLLWVADRVEASLLRYMDAHDIEQSWETRERVVVALTGAPGNDAIIRRAARLARRSHGDLIGVHVTRPGAAEPGAPDDVAARLDEHRTLLERLGGRYHDVVGADVAEALVAFTRAERATQLVVGASRRSRWQELRHGSVTGHIVRELREADVHVISAAPVGDGAGERRGGVLPSVARVRLPAPRVRLAWLLAVVLLGVITVAGVALRGHAGRNAPLPAYLLAVALVASVGGAVPATATALAASLLTNWFFTEPLHTLRVKNGEDLLALVAFLGVAAIVANLVAVVTRRTGEAERARAEAEALARSTGALVTEPEPLPALLAQIRSTFALDALSVVTRDDGDDVEPGRWRVEAAAGPEPPGSPRDGDTVDVDERTRLVLRGRALSADDRRLLRSFAAQLGAALAGRALRAEAAQAGALAGANELRTAMLQSVSHDLRTPLASIKASVTSLLAPDLSLPADAARDLLETIDEEADRLNRVVGNLLDMSRLQAQALDVHPVAVGVDDLVGAALASLGPAVLTGAPTGPTAANGPRVVVELGDDPPVVWADPVLVERALANLLANAVAWSPPDEPVRVGAARLADCVVVRIADRGPGIAPAARGFVFAPFQRLGDRSSQAGVGLGLAVARGFVDAVGGSLTLDDTPGGGLSVHVSLPLAPVTREGGTVHEALPDEARPDEGPAHGEPAHGEPAHGEPAHGERA